MGFQASLKDFASFSEIKKYVKEKKTPVIVNWFSKDDGHYSVVVGIDHKKIYLQDPGIGKIRILDLETFNRLWFDFKAPIFRSKNDLIIRRMIVIYPKK